MKAVSDKHAYNWAPPNNDKTGEKSSLPGVLQVTHPPAEWNKDSTGSATSSHNNNLTNLVWDILA